MKHVTIVKNIDGSDLSDLVNRWIEENEEQILEIIDIEYSDNAGIYYALITYEERYK